MVALIQPENVTLLYSHNKTQDFALYQTLSCEHTKQRYLEFVMMNGEFGRIPDHGGDRVALLQGLVDQKLSGLARSSQHSDLHPQTVAHRVYSALIY